MSIKKIEFKNELVLKVLKVDNKFEAILAPDTHDANGKHLPFVIVFETLRNCISDPENTQIPIDITSFAKQIASQAKDHQFPFSAVATNYKGGGDFHFQLIADKEVVHNEVDKLSEWESKQYVFMIQRKER